MEKVAHHPEVIQVEPHVLLGTAKSEVVDIDHLGDEVHEGGAATLGHTVEEHTFGMAGDMDSDEGALQQDAICEEGGTQGIFILLDKLTFCGQHEDDQIVSVSGCK